MKHGVFPLMEFDVYPEDTLFLELQKLVDMMSGDAVDSSGDSGAFEAALARLDSGGALFATALDGHMV